MVRSVWAARAAVRTCKGLGFLVLVLLTPHTAPGAMLAAGNDNLFIAPWYPMAIGFSITVLVIALDALGSGLQQQFGAPTRRTAVVA